MEIAKENITTPHRIQSYDNESITVDGQKYKNSILICEQYVKDWHITSTLNLEVYDFEIPKDCEILIIGSGPQLQTPPPEFFVAMNQRGIGLEVMTTQAAIRTYSILHSDRRRVLAALVV